MTEPRPLPLAAAAVRLQGKPGRPRTRAPSPPKAAPPPIAAVAAVAPVAARLVDVKGAALYLGGVSPWTVRGLIANGTLMPVRIPLPGGRALRRVLLDLRDLDAVLERWKA